MSPWLKKVFLYKHAAAGASVRPGSSSLSKGMLVHSGPGGGLIIALPEGREAAGRLEILDLAGRRAAVFPAAARVHGRPGWELSGPVTVFWRAPGGAPQARMVLPSPARIRGGR